MTPILLTMPAQGGSSKITEKIARIVGRDGIKLRTWTWVVTLVLM